MFNKILLNIFLDIVVLLNDTYTYCLGVDRNKILLNVFLDIVVLFTDTYTYCLRVDLDRKSVV